VGSAIVLALAIGIVYGRALDVPFVFDDDVTITQKRVHQIALASVGTGEPMVRSTRPSATTTGGRWSICRFDHYYFGVSIQLDTTPLM